MDVTPQLLRAKVMHKRLFPRENGFTYRVYYLAFPLRVLETLNDGWRFAVNRSGIMQFREKDYGTRDGSPLLDWVRGILREWQLNEANGEIVLITMPRVMGYGFNPVSFWLCLDRSGAIRAILSEVHNTYGDAHTYLCAHPDHRPITGEDWLEAKKLFHVSPFLERKGSYAFRFDYSHDKGKFGAWIDYYDANGNKQLLTSITGALIPWNRRSLRKAFCSVPLVPLKVIALIHYQAVKLMLKRQRFIDRPEPLSPSLSGSSNLTKSSSSGKAQDNYSESM